MEMIKVFGSDSIQIN